MKRVILSLLTVVVMLVASCKKDDPAPAAQLPSAPEALAEHNTKSGGVYRATIATATTSGSFTITLQNGKKEVNMKYNNATKVLTTTDLNSWTSGDTLSAVFTNGTWSLELHISGSGNAISVGLSLDGVTDFNGAIAKELSTAQVKVYEGTYSGSDSGKWNFIVQANQVSGVYYSSTNNEGIFGTAVGNNITLTSDSGNVNAVGTFGSEGNTASGAWTATGSDSGTWSGTRTF